RRGGTACGRRSHRGRQHRRGGRRVQRSSDPRLRCGPRPPDGALHRGRRRRRGRRGSCLAAALRPLPGLPGSSMRIVATHGADLAWGAAPAYDIVSQMDTDTEHALGGAISPTAGVPLRVAVYMRIDEAIRTGALPRAGLIPSGAGPGGRFNAPRPVPREPLLLPEEAGPAPSRRGPPRASLIPSEAELGGRFNVSRTVIREALLLLEEDGLVHSRRGIGRFVSDHPPRSGIERLEPLERLISAGRPVRITRTEHTEQTSTSSFVTDFLGGDGHSSSWFIESVIGDGSGPIALTQEHLPASERLDGPLSPLRDVLAS